MIKQMLEGLSAMTEYSEEVRPDIILLKFKVVNACIVIIEKDRWVLIDTGLENSAGYITDFANEHFADLSKPEMILLTCGHFDHTGSVSKLAPLWDVPVYAHRLEMPYLTGDKKYPPGRPDEANGLIAQMSARHPDKPAEIRKWLRPLPDDGTLPQMPGWRWIATPGYTEGHVSFFREKDRALIAGEAFTGIKQESLLDVLTHKEAAGGPPAYFTQDWNKAKESITRLSELNPALAVMSHGGPMSGETLRKSLEYLLAHFDSLRTQA